METTTTVEEERLEKVTQIVADFAQAYWNRKLVWQISQLVIGAEIVRGRGETHPYNPTAQDLIEKGAEAQEWLYMAKAAVGLVERTEETQIYIHQICQDVAEWLFAIPGSYTYQIPPEFASTPFGSLWAAAMVWLQNDDLITIAKAAEIAGITIQAISQSKKIKFYTDPLAPNRQGRRLVRKSEVEAIWPKEQQVNGKNS